MFLCFLASSLIGKGGSDTDDYSSKGKGGGMWQHEIMLVINNFLFESRSIQALTSTVAVFLVISQVDHRPTTTTITLQRVKEKVVKE
jgi:hypothetical protein